MAKEFDILVAGGGIAGLTAGLTAGRLGHSVMVLTGDVLGGNLLGIEKIDGFPGFADGVAGYELCPIAQGQAADLSPATPTATPRDGDENENAAIMTRESWLVDSGFA